MSTTVTEEVKMEFAITTVLGLFLATLLWIGPFFEDLKTVPALLGIWCYLNIVLLVFLELVTFFTYYPFCVQRRRYYFYLFFYFILGCITIFSMVGAYMNYQGWSWLVMMVMYVLVFLGSACSVAGLSYRIVSLNLNK